MSIVSRSDTVHGYTVRRERLALSIKVHRGATDAELASVSEELRLTGKVAELEPGKPLGFAAYFQALADSRKAGECERFAALQGFAVESAWELVEEDARELFGAGVTLSTAGASGGWLLLEGGGLEPGDVAEAERAVNGAQAHNADMSDVAEARALLAALDEFRERVAAYVEDFPRAVAWQVGENAFEGDAEDLARRTTREAAEARLERAAETLADKVRAVTLHMGEGFSFAVDELCPALAEFDSARSALQELRP